MNNNYKQLATLYIIIGLLLVSLFLQRSCSSNEQTQKVKIVKQYDTIYKPKYLKDKIVTKYITTKGKTIVIPGKVDTVEIKVFEKAIDSIKLEKYIDATKIRSYKTQFNDSVANVSIYTETKGELLKIVPTVQIKQVKKVETVFAMYAGLEVSNSLYLNNPNVKVDLGFQNKKGDIFTVGYDLDQNIYLGYKKQLFKIRK